MLPMVVVDTDSVAKVVSTGITSNVVMALGTGGHVIVMVVTTNDSLDGVSLIDNVVGANSPIVHLLLGALGLISLSIIGIDISMGIVNNDMPAVGEAVGVVISIAGDISSGGVGIDASNRA